MFEKKKFGIDTLFIWASAGERYQIYDLYLRQLEDGRQRLEKENLKEVRIDLKIPLYFENKKTRYFYLSRGRHYRYVLSCKDEMGKRVVIIKISDPGKKVKHISYPQIYFEFHGGFYRGLSFKERIKRIVSFLSRFFRMIAGVEPEIVGLSRIDLYADIVMPRGHIDMEHMRGMVSRAVVRRSHVEGGAMSNTPPQSCVDGDMSVVVSMAAHRWSGFEVGRGDIRCRIYSKSVQARHDVAARAYVQALGVSQGQELVRCEFQLRGAAIRELRLSERFRWATLDGLGEAWRYLTQRWLRVCIPSRDRTVTRWQVRDWWAAFQEAWGVREAVVRLRRAPVLRAIQLMRQAFGALCASSSMCSLSRLEFEAMRRRFVQAAAWALYGDSTKGVLVDKRLIFEYDDYEARYTHIGACLT